MSWGGSNESAYWAWQCCAQASTLPKCGVCMCVCMTECVLRFNFPSLAKHKAVVCGLSPRQKPRGHPQLQVNTWMPSSVRQVCACACACLGAKRDHLPRISCLEVVTHSLSASHRDPPNKRPTAQPRLSDRGTQARKRWYTSRTRPPNAISKGQRIISKNQIHHTRDLAGVHKPKALPWLLSAVMRHRGASWYYLRKHPSWL